MSDAASDDVVHTTQDGVTVEKTYEPDDFPVPAIAFTITSERDEPVSVRMADTVPEDIPPEDIGFHPEYGAEFWDVEGSTIVFTREFEPHEEYVTVYGLRGKDAAEVDRFLTEPELTSVDTVDGASGDVVRDVLGDDAPDSEAGDVAVDVSDPVAEPGSEAGEDDGDLDIDLPAPGGDDASGPGAAGGPAAGADATGPAPAVAEGESLAAALAAEIRAGEVDDAELAELRDALGVTADDSTDARIEHLQSTVGDIDAYTDAIEGFLDEEGDAQTVLRDVQADYEAAIDRVDDVESAVDRIDDLEAEAEALREDVAEATDDRLTELEADVEALENELADVAEMRDRLTNALGGLGGGYEPTDHETEPAEDGDGDADVDADEVGDTGDGDADVDADEVGDTGDEDADVDADEVGDTGDEDADVDDDEGPELDL
jgi:polyhydroxyalkanoate synthesis regulator phasin